MRNPNPIFDPQKFKELLLIILSHPNSSFHTEDALCSLLYLIDFSFYEKYEEHLTGATYKKITKKKKKAGF